MSLSLYDLLKQEVKRMLVGIGKNGHGNIHPLIMNEIEKYIVELVLRETDYNFVLAAKMLGISRSTLYRKLDSLGISKKL
ncbi:MAG: helix-turn-helix domain-containing protein [bacterium]